MSQLPPAAATNIPILTNVHPRTNLIIVYEGDRNNLKLDREEDRECSSVKVHITLIVSLLVAYNYTFDILVVVVIKKSVRRHIMKMLSIFRHLGSRAVGCQY